jgi:hypothetical protein
VQFSIFSWAVQCSYHIPYFVSPLIFVQYIASLFRVNLTYFLYLRHVLTPSWFVPPVVLCDDLVPCLRKTSTITTPSRPAPTCATMAPKQKCNTAITRVQVPLPHLIPVYKRSLPFQILYEMGDPRLRSICVPLQNFSKDRHNPDRLRRGRIAQS